MSLGSQQTAWMCGRRGLQGQQDLLCRGWRRGASEEGRDTCTATLAIPILKIVTVRKHDKEGSGFVPFPSLGPRLTWDQWGEVWEHHTEARQETEGTHGASVRETKMDRGDLRARENRWTR